MILAGDGPSRPALEKLANDLDVTPRHYFYRIHQRASTTVYRAIDLFLFPSLAEPLGTSMLAAMSHGLPVIGVASGGVPEMVTSEKNGLLVPTPDPDAFAAIIKRLLRNRDEARTFGDAARATIEEKFTDDRMVEATIHNYQSLQKINIPAGITNPTRRIPPRLSICNSDACPDTSLRPLQPLPGQN